MTSDSPPYLCPQCGARYEASEIDWAEALCPRCQVPLLLEEPQAELCPVCGSMVDAADESCVTCGAPIG